MTRTYFQVILRSIHPLGLGLMGGVALAMPMATLCGVNEARLVDAAADMLFLKACGMSAVFVQWDVPVIAISLIHGVASSEAWLYVLFVGYLVFGVATVKAPEDRALNIELQTAFVYTMLWGTSRVAALPWQVSDFRRQSLLFTVAVSLQLWMKSCRGYNIIIFGTLVLTMGWLLEKEMSISSAEDTGSHSFVKRTSDDVSLGSAGIVMILGLLVCGVIYWLQQRRQRNLPSMQGAQTVFSVGSGAGHSTSTEVELGTQVQPLRIASPASEPAHLPSDSASAPDMRSVATTLQSNERKLSSDPELKKRGDERMNGRLGEVDEGGVSCGGVEDEEGAMGETPILPA